MSAILAPNANQLTFRAANFGEAVVAHNAVQSFAGPEHPLVELTPGAEGMGESLYDELYQDDEERKIRDGEEAQLIFDSLHALAKDEKSPHQIKAKKMLGAFSVRTSSDFIPRDNSVETMAIAA